VYRLVLGMKIFYVDPAFEALRYAVVLKKTDPVGPPISVEHDISCWHTTALSSSRAIHASCSMTKDHAVNRPMWSSAKSFKQDLDIC
jgi:hypothetical protein